LTTASLEVASLTEVADALRTGRVTSLALTQRCLERARRLQPVINCFITVEEEHALTQAAAADRAYASGRLLGPLHGVPLAHKDMYYRVGRRTTCGSRIRGQAPDTTTATLLARLESAGAVTLGTLNMTEFALGPTGHNAIHGHCRNPWNPLHIACGSSSGSGAAVGARIAYGSLGSDTGGSVRLPASANGVIGLKPTYARLSRAGMMGLAWSVDTPGLLARTARDCARLLTVVAGADPADPTCSSRAVPDYEAALTVEAPPSKLGVAANYFFERTTPEVRSLVDAAVQVLANAGHAVASVNVPQPEPLSELSRALVYPEVAALHGHWLRSCGADYSPQVRMRALSGTVIPAATYLEAQQLRPGLLRRFVTQVFANCEVLVTPTLGMPVPTLAATDVGVGASLWQTLAGLVHCTAAFNYLGLPALSLPIGYTRNGLPAGLQLIARPFAEATLLRVAARYQKLTDWHTRVPALAA
jgi:aspartyl-tRNA(Asn)/glutamyl-tRNA(Gln) amidotransferase subunit A